MDLEDALLSERKYSNDFQEALIKSYEEKIKDMTTVKKFVPKPRTSCESRTSGEELIHKPETKLKEQTTSLKTRNVRKQVH